MYICFKNKYLFILVDNADCYNHRLISTRTNLVGSSYSGMLMRRNHQNIIKLYHLVLNLINWHFMRFGQFNKLTHSFCDGKYIQFQHCWPHISNVSEFKKCYQCVLNISPPSQILFQKYSKHKVLFISTIFLSLLFPSASTDSMFYFKSSHSCHSMTKHSYGFFLSRTLLYCIFC